MIENITRGIGEFGRNENLHSRNSHPLRELNWLTSAVVSKDLQLTHRNRHNILDKPVLYFQRLREIGLTFGEIFVFQEYGDWQPETDNPSIIDLGGDVGGFSVLYWKTVAPNARVTVVEANPSTAAVMSDSFKRKGLKDVEVINAAASDKNGFLDLHLSGYNPTNYIGKRTGPLSSRVRTVNVPSIRASDLVGETDVDLFKMDIEGGEGIVIRDLADTGKIKKIKTIMMEYHCDPTNTGNSLKDLLGILGEYGFNISNVHRSGIGRLGVRRNGLVDLNTISPESRIAFAFSAKK